MDFLETAAAKAAPRRFTGAPITAMGDLYDDDLDAPDERTDADREDDEECWRADCDNKSAREAA